MRFSPMFGHQALLFVVFTALGCSGTSTGQEIPDPGGFPEIHGPFFGQTSPGLTPVRFGPSQLHADQSWFWHGAPSFSLRLGWEFSLTANGTLYLVLWDESGPGIYRSSLENGSYTTPVSLGAPVNTTSSALAPLVAPDESYLIFASNRPGGFGMHDLWITFRQNDGSWSEPLNMGPEINSSGEDGGPTLSADSRYLFFTTQRSGDLGSNPYWVSTDVIDYLRAGAGI